MSDDGRITMNIIEKHFYRSATLPEAPERATRAEAEADEARGVELAAYLALLPNITAEQKNAAWNVARSGAWSAKWGTAWDAARDVAYDVERGASRDASYDAARSAEWAASRDAGRNAGWAAQAIIVRDLISVEQFDILTEPMRAAGIDFDNLAGTP